MFKLAPLLRVSHGWSVSCVTALLCASTAAMAVQDTPPGNWDPTSPEDVARRAAEGEGGSGGADPLKGPDVPPQQVGGGRRGGGGAGGMQMKQPTVEGLLEARCGQCHGVDKQKGGLQIVPVARLHEGPEKFRVVTVGDPDASLLVKRIKLPKGHDDVMPPEGEPLSATEIKVIEDWIRNGATEAKAREPMAALSAGQAQRSRSTSARAFLRAYMALKDLTPEQRRAGIKAATEARKSLSAQDKQVLEDFRAMQRANQSGGEIPQELVARREAIRSKMQEMQARAQELQTQLWSGLSPEQQAALRASLEKKPAGTHRRRQRPGGKPAGDV